MLNNLLRLAGSRMVACYLNNRPLLRLPAAYDSDTGHIREDRSAKLDAPKKSNLNNCTFFKRYLRDA